ncbi:MAG: metallophosphoesterase, partial [Pseudomonadota bacterium]
AQLAALAQQGKQVYVVPGNHDINNGRSMNYSGDTSRRVATVSPEEFKDIYSRFGFAQAVAVDPGSLSYIVEPVPGLWLFGLDSCSYRENVDNEEPVTGGAFYGETLKWIEEMLIKAIREKKAVIGFMHHGVLEHYPANKKYYKDYLLDDFEVISKMFAAYGMRFVFTGHYHAQDCTGKEWSSAIPHHFLVDTETGSLVTWPAPVRHITVHNQRMTIQSSSIQKIESHPDDFPAFAEQFVLKGMTGIINATLTRYGVPVQDQKLLTPQIAQAYVTHLKGDEKKPDTYLDFTGVSLRGVLVGVVQGDLIRGWYTDLPPADNNLSIDILTGAAE